jgi:hypothetical protein
MIFSLAGPKLDTDLLTRAKAEAIFSLVLKIVSINKSRIICKLFLELADVEKTGDDDNYIPWVMGWVHSASNFVHR